MRNLIPILAVLLATSAFAAEPWQQLYTGAEATGDNVIALWQFQPGQELKDVSGHGHDLKLRSQSVVVKEGPFGGALESFGANTESDKEQGAIAADRDDLTPAGAFTLEAWFMLKPDANKWENIYFFDKKNYPYAKDIPQANWDYSFYLSKAGENKRRFMSSLGFGKDSAFISGPVFDVEPGKWMHAAMTYDGAGRVRFFLDGKLVSKQLLEGRGPVTNGSNGLVIGDRFGSTHSGFPGYLAQVRVSKGIVPYFSGGLIVGLGRARSAYVRMEKNVSLALQIANDSPTPMTNGKVQVTFGGVTKNVTIPDLAPNAETSIPLALDTTVRPGTYDLKALATAVSNGQPVRIEKEIPLTIVPRPLPNQMPVVMWGTGDIERLKSIGFTHNLIGLGDNGLIWNRGTVGPAMTSDAIEQQGKLLDDYLKNGLNGAVSAHPGTWVTGNPERKAKYNRVDRLGVERTNPNVCGNFKEVQEFCYNVGASIAQTFGQYPALTAALIHSEVRDGSDLCFHEHDKAAFKAASGFDIPAEAAGKNGINYRALKGFPANRVIPDDYQLLTFYKWFWKNGDGWNILHSQLSNGIKSTGRKDLWTFFDPAVRVPDIWGSGGDVDVISQWTYSYPDPIKIGQATDELFAMAGGKPGQQVMKMTQIIWYRSQTAPKPPDNEADRKDWEKKLPNAEEAAFITIAPDHMREAFWSKISRPIRGIMYHGWGSLVDIGATKGYVFTNPETQNVLTDLTHNVVRPLGPTLLQVPDRKTDVAMLESAASQIFAGRGSYGWSSSWEADMHLILQWAHLQPRILFDETIMRDGLDDYRVLVMPNCDVLTQGVVDRIKAFQKRGGIVVADENLCPAILPDIVVPTAKRTGKADQDKAALQVKAAALRKELDPFYSRYGDSPEADIVLRFRQYGGSDYLFALNDKREFGDYVGHHGKVMEKGLPLSSRLWVARKAGTIYDLVKHCAVPSKPVAGGMQFEASFGPGDGKVFLITPAPVASVKVTAPAKVKRGGGVDIVVAVLDAKGQPLSAVVPVQLQVTDSKGQQAEFSGYYGAKDGKAIVHLDVASNDPTGTWQIKAKELASGLSKQQALTVVQ
ncbi:MAG: LamG-like jellyroll fold domain-containing protein [Armatimonadia bacterium]